MDETTSKEIEEMAMDEAYLQYLADYSMAMTRHIHPMFRNGTFSEDNSYQPEHPGKELTKEEFKEKVNDGNDDTKECYVFEALFRYIYKEENL